MFARCAMEPEKSILTLILLMLTNLPMVVDGQCAMRVMGAVAVVNAEALAGNNHTMIMMIKKFAGRERSRPFSYALKSADVCAFDDCVALQLQYFSNLIDAKNAD